MMATWPTMPSMYYRAIPMRRRAVVWVMRAAVSRMVTVIDRHRGIARDRRGVVRWRRVVNGRCAVDRRYRRCIGRLGSREIAHLFGRHATRQRANKPKQKDITNDIHDSPLFFRFDKAILPCFSDKSQELSQNKNPLLRRRRDFGIIFAVFTPRSGGEIGRHACLRCMWRDPCGFESRPEHHVVGYSSGQRGQTVNLLACAFGGSNPPPTTN